jgi:sugar phosphate isomerase/epimerase
MRYAICNETWQKVPFPEVCQRAAAAGYSGLELAPFTLKDDPRKLGEADAIALTRVARDHGLEILGLHWLLTCPSWFHITTPDALLRQETLRFAQHLARFCAMLGGKIMVWGSPRARSLQLEWQYEDAFQRAAELLHGVAEEAGKYGVTIAMEPLAKKETNFLNTAAETVRFCQAVGHPACKLHLDVKAMSDEDKPIPQIIAESKDWMVHFHANDPNLLGPGMGQVAFEPILQALYNKGYKDWLSVEVFDYSPGADVIAEKSIHYLQEVMQRIKKSKETT